MATVLSALMLLGARYARSVLADEPAAKDASPRAVLLVHGGCGVLARQQMTPELETRYRADLTAALRAGHAVLAKPDGTSLDAVVAAIKVLEDSPLFNAGKGAVFTREGRNELDASIMDGRTRDAGAVASVTTIKNPITAARAVMEKSGHVLMVGPGAESFAKQAGLEMVDPKYFWTQFRWDQYQATLKAEGDQSRTSRPAAIDRFGTVGAVAVDQAGNLAAGTSTGGL
ncbi:MAG TPA: isoaspartyl peptidase/L-asparaginase, partial [Pirellulaceae bacterium]|nr:isoaspartyl peptidase/L-asparaginase [Pirellulaceae bacterium]